MSLEEALSRTILLLKQDLDPKTPNALILNALTSVRVVLRARDDTLATHSGQSGFVAAALTLARSGHEVWIDAGEIPLLGPQPPLTGDRLVAGLLEVGEDLLPGLKVQHGCPDWADLALLFGAAPETPNASRNLRLNATNWSAELGGDRREWAGREWPIGALALSAMAASEAFKTASRKLAGRARDPGFYSLMHAATDRASFSCALADTRKVQELPPMDLVSGGAIANASLFALLRLPGLRGKARVLDDDWSALSNLNRNALLRRSALDRPKVEDLVRFSDGLEIVPEPVRYVEGMPLADHVLVGVDDIPSRWAVQRGNPGWVGVGATEGFGVMASSHPRGEPCAGCLHPAAAAPAAGPIPTAAFVSFFAGLMLVVIWLRELSGDRASPIDRQLYVSALRPEGWSLGWMPTAESAICPVACQASTRRRAA